MVWNDIAGVADHLAGSTDEAVARTFDDTEGGGVVDGYTETVTGVADHLAGSTDEAIGRQFDDTPGGGLYDGVAGWFDHAAGSTDEAIGRQFDDDPGGGAADVVAQQYWGLWDWVAGDVDDTVQNSLDVSNTARWGLLLVAALAGGYAANEFVGGSA